MGKYPMYLFLAQALQLTGDWGKTFARNWTIDDKLCVVVGVQ